MASLGTQCAVAGFMPAGRNSMYPDPGLPKHPQSPAHIAPAEMHLAPSSSREDAARPDHGQVVVAHCRHKFPRRLLWIGEVH